MPPLLPWPSRFNAPASPLEGNAPPFPPKHTDTQRTYGNDSAWPSTQSPHSEFPWPSRFNAPALPVEGNAPSFPPKHTDTQPTCGNNSAWPSTQSPHGELPWPSRFNAPALPLEGNAPSFPPKHTDTQRTCGNDSASPPTHLKSRMQLSFEECSPLGECMHLLCQCGCNRCRITQIARYAIHNRTADDNTIGRLRDCTDMVRTRNTKADNHR